MHFNSTKREILRVTNKKEIIEFQYFIQDDIIREVQYARYVPWDHNKQQIIMVKSHTQYN